MLEVHLSRDMLPSPLLNPSSPRPLAQHSQPVAEPPVPSGSSFPILPHITSPRTTARMPQRNMQLSSTMGRTCSQACTHPEATSDAASIPSEGFQGKATCKTVTQVSALACVQLEAMPEYTASFFCCSFLHETANSIYTTQSGLYELEQHLRT